MSKNITKLNYKEAWEYFSKNTVNQPIEEATKYLATLRRALTKDVRKEEQAKEKILSTITPRTLIFVFKLSIIFYLISFLIWPFILRKFLDTYSF